MVFDFGTIGAYTIGLFLLYVCCWIFLRPIKWFLKIILNSLFGGVFIFIINLIGGYFNLHIALNPLNALITGILGIPGIILTYILQTFI